MADLDPAQLAALAAVVAEGTFDAAAHRLHVTPSAISQRLKALEASVGRVLVTRAKPVQPTEPGRAVLRLARQVASLTDETLREIGAESNHRGVVPVAVNGDSLDTWLLPALVTLPDGVLVDLRRDDQERTADQLRQGTVMAAITSETQTVAGCTITRLGRMRYRACAAPSFVARWFSSAGDTDAFAFAPVVVFDRDDTLQDRYLRRRSRRHVDPPRSYVPGSHAFLDAVRLGLGWGMLPDQQAASDLRRGTLVELDRGRHIDVTLHWQQWRLRSVALDAVAEAVRGAAGATLT